MNRYKLARIGKGLTMKELAKMCGISISYLHHIENERRKPTKEYLDLIDVDKDTEWYETIKGVLSFCLIPEDKNEIIKSLNNALKFNNTRG